MCLLHGLARGLVRRLLHQTRVRLLVDESVSLWRVDAKWIEETTAEIALLTTLGKEVAYKMTLLTPTQAEKAAKESGLEPKAFEALIARGEGVPTLAPAEDKRPALPMQAEREFSVDFFA